MQVSEENQSIWNNYIRWYYDSNVWKHTTWRGIRTLKLPSDLWNYQEIISERRIEWVIETGTRHGGSALFLAEALMARASQGKVISIDVDEESRQVQQHPSIDFVIGDSADAVTALAAVSSMPLDPGPIFMILDSDHSMDHVLKELELWVPFLNPGDTLIIEDTIINGHPVRADFGPGPYEAVQEYLEKHPGELIHDQRRELKFGITTAVAGYYIKAGPPPDSGNVGNERGGRQSLPVGLSLPGSIANHQPISSPPTSDALNLEIDLTDAGQIDAALGALDSQLANDGSNPELLVAMSHLLEAKGQLDQAIESMQFAVLLDGANISLLIRLGDLLIKAGDPDSAEGVYSQVIALAPELSNGLVGLAQALSDQGRMNEALLHAERAVQQDPQQPRTHEIHGLVLAQLGRMGDAIAAFTDGLQLDPSNANQHAYRGMAKLACMHDQEAWEDFAWRFASDTGDVERHQDLPLWAGDPISTPVLIWREQGLGDEILYFGWLRYLMATGQPFVAEVEPRLLALCRRSLPGAIIIPLGESPNDFGVTHALPMGSLGEFVGAHRSTPAFPPRYLQSEPATTARFAHQLTSTSADLSPLRIGLAWKSIRPRVGAFKSIELSLFLPMARDPRLQLINLQYDTTAEEIEGFNKQAFIPMIDPSINKRQDIDSLASVIDCCDLVITISNVTAHLACALGKECWVLLPAGRGLIWYWHCNVSYSPWYPTARLYRQKTINSWDGVVRRVHDALAERLQRKTPPMAG